MMHVLDVASREASRSGGAFALELLKYSYVSTCGDSHQLRCQWWAGFPDHDLLVIPGVVCRGLEGLARVELGYQQFISAEPGQVRLLQMVTGVLRSASSALSMGRRASGSARRRAVGKLTEADARPALRRARVGHVRALRRPQGAALRMRRDRSAQGFVPAREPVGRRPGRRTHTGGLRLSVPHCKIAALL